MRNKYSANFERDWQFYINNLNVFSFWGGDTIFEPLYSIDGLSAKDFFYKMDSLGFEKMKNKACNEPKLVSDVLRFKKALNFNLKQWCEGYRDCGMGTHEYIQILIDPPDWVLESFRKQLNKLNQDKGNK